MHLISCLNELFDADLHMKAKKFYFYPAFDITFARTLAALRSENLLTDQQMVQPCEIHNME